MLKHYEFVITVSDIVAKGGCFASGYVEEFRKIPS